MLDTIVGRDAPPALDMTEVRVRPAPARRPARRAGPSRALVAGGTALGLAAAAGLSYAALSFFMSEPGKPRRGTIVTGSVDYPDLKDGVPALVTPRGQVRVVGTPSSASPAQEVAAMTASPVDSSALANLAGGGGLPRPTIAPTSTPVPSVVRTGTAAAVPRADPPRTLAATAPPPLNTPAAALAPTPAPLVASAMPVPVPAPRPTATMPTRTVVRSPDVPRTPDSVRAAAPGIATAPTAPSQRLPTTRPPARSEPARPVTTAEEDDHINVFGLAVPTIGATGRRIKEGVEALGDAVGRL